MVVDSAQNIAALFEAKTDISSSSIYQAVGQLMLNGTKAKVQRRVLVVPEAPSPETRELLSEIGIAVLIYKWDGSIPRFPNLKKVVGIAV